MFGPCFVRQLLVPFLVLYHPEEDRAGCFTGVL